MGYKVDYDALDMLYASIDKQASEWEDELDATRTMLTLLASSPNMSGTGARAIRCYFENVHGPVLDRLEELLALHRDSCLIYKQAYQHNVDTSLHAVMEETELASIREALAKNNEKALLIQDEVSDALGQISDIFSVSYRDVSEVDKAHSDEDSDILNLDTKIQALERDHSARDFVESGAVCNSLSGFIKEIGSKGRAYKLSVSKDDLLRMASYQALSAAGVNVNARYKALASRIDEAKELENKRMGQIADETLPPGVLAKGAVLSGSTGTAGTVLGISSAGSVSGSVLSGQVEKVGKATWDITKGNAGAEVGIAAKGSLASGEVKGNIGMLQGSLQGSVGSGEASARAGASLMKNGKLSPAIEGKAKAEVSALSGKAEVKFGNENVDGHVTAKGSVGHAEAEASGALGVITLKDEDGNVSRAVGIQGGVKAEACAAEGKISGGLTIAGIKIDVGVKGKAGAIGGEMGGQITTNGISGKIGASVILGVGFDVNIDWSGFHPF